MFAAYGIPTQKGLVIEDPAQVTRLSLKYPVVLKAQVGGGGGGRAGGIKAAATPDEARVRAAAILGMDIKGERVRRLLVAEAVDIGAEYYLAFIIDRTARRLTAIASAAGGIDIEEVARTSPEKITRQTVHPFVGFHAYHARKLGRSLGLTGTLLSDFGAVAGGFANVCIAEGRGLAEVNPLAVVGGRVLAGGAKGI